MLILLPAATSGTALILRPIPELVTVLVLAVFFAGTAAGLGGGCSMMVTAVGRTNIPLPMSHSKYRSPWTLPSFLPLSSSNSTPTQSPAAKWGCPIYRTVAKRPSVSSMTWPIWSCSDMMRSSSETHPHGFGVEGIANFGSRAVGSSVVEDMLSRSDRKGDASSNFKAPSTATQENHKRREYITTRTAQHNYRVPLWTNINTQTRLKEAVLAHRYLSS
jgi:hypothetical protein